MSEQSIYDKSLVIRNETQEYANTRGRVADVLDDINLTKANKGDVDAAIQILLDELGLTEAELYAYIDSQNNLQDLDIQEKVDKPLELTGNIRYILSNVDGVISWKKIDTTAGYIPEFDGDTFKNSVLFQDSNGNIGVGTILPQSKLHISGYIQGDAYVYTPITANSIPNKTWTDGLELFFTDQYGVNRQVSGYSPPDEILTIGAITATTSSINIALYSGGFNSVRINSAIWSKTTPDAWTFPTVTGEEVFDIYALPDPQIFYLARNGEEIPEGALIVSTITISPSGVVIGEPTGSQYKQQADDNWRNVNIISNAGIYLPATTRPSSFHVTFGEGISTPKVLGLEVGAKVFAWPGKAFTVFTEKDTMLEAPDAFGSTVLPFAAGTSYLAKAGTYTELQIKYGKLVVTTGEGATDEQLALKANKDASEMSPANIISWQEALNIGNASFPPAAENELQLESDSSSPDGVKWAEKATKYAQSLFLHYWNGSAKSWVSSGLKFVAGAINQLEFSGRIKADAFILPANATTAIANRLRSDGNRLKYANDSAVERDIAYLTDIQSRIIKTHIHSGNQEIYISAIDYATGYVTTTVPHGITDSFRKLAGLFTNDFAINNRRVYSARTIPVEYRQNAVYISRVDDVTLKISKSDGSLIPVNTSISPNNGWLDITKWHIELCNDWVITGISPGIFKFEVNIYGMAVAGVTSAATFRYIYLSVHDNSGTGVFNFTTSLQGAFLGCPTVNSVLCTNTMNFNILNSWISITGYENSYGGYGDDSAFGGYKPPVTSLLMDKNKGIAGISGTSYANGSIITIYI